MAINLPPVVRTSKRAIPGTRVFDAAKVFADYNSDTNRSDVTSHYRTTFNSAHEKPKSFNIHRAGKINKPDPTHVHFLYDNTRFTNEPVCHAATNSTRRIQHEWWPDKIVADIKPRPAYSCDSSSRSDFRPIDSSRRPNGLTRFSCIEGKRSTALGIVPVTELPARHMKTEKISFIHQYDARNSTRERGKLHGSFVWDTTDKTKQKLQRRFAKRNFFDEEKASTFNPMIHNEHALNPESARRHEIGVLIKKTEPIESRRQKSSIPDAESARPQMAQNEGGNIEEPCSVKDQGIVYFNNQESSPPPHLC